MSILKISFVLFTFVISFSRADSINECRESYQSFLLAEQAAVERARNLIYEGNGLDPAKTYRITLKNEGRIVESTAAGKQARWQSCFDLDKNPETFTVQNGVVTEIGSFCLNNDLSKRRERYTGLGSALKYLPGIDWKSPRILHLSSYAGPHIGGLPALYSVSFDCLGVKTETPATPKWKLACETSIGDLGKTIEQLSTSSLKTLSDKEPDRLNMLILAAPSSLKPGEFEFEACLFAEE